MPVPEQADRSSTCQAPAAATLDDVASPDQAEKIGRSLALPASSDGHLGWCVDRLEPPSVCFYEKNLRTALDRRSVEENSYAHEITIDRLLVDAQAVPPFRFGRGSG